MISERMTARRSSAGFHVTKAERWGTAADSRRKTFAGSPSGICAACEASSAGALVAIGEGTCDGVPFGGTGSDTTRFLLFFASAFSP